MNIIKVYFIKKRTFLEAITQPRPLFMVLIVTSILWIAICFGTYGVMEARERPIMLSESASLDPGLRTGLVLSDFAEFDVAKDRFVVDGSLWFEYDPQIYSSEDFQNFAFLRGRVLRRSNPLISHHGSFNRLVIAFTVETKSKIEYGDFPLDKHRIDLVVTDILPAKSTFFSPTNISFELAPHAIERGWYSERTVIAAGRSLERLNSACMVFSIFVARSSFKTPVMALMPLLLIFLIGLVSLSFEVLKNFNAILSLSVGGLTGLVFFRSVLDQFQPQTEHFTIADKMYLLMMTLTVFILGIQIYILHFFSKLQDQTHLTKLIAIYVNNINIVRGCVFIVFTVLLLMATIVMFL